MNVSSVIIGIVCTIILFSLKYLNQRYKFKFPIPAELIVVSTGCIRIIIVFDMNVDLRQLSFGTDQAGVAPAKFRQGADASDEEANYFDTRALKPDRS